MTTEQLKSHRYALIVTNTGLPLGGGTRIMADYITKHGYTIQRVIYHGDSCHDYLQHGTNHRLNFSLA